MEGGESGAGEPAPVARKRAEAHQTAQVRRIERGVVDDPLDALTRALA